jgi:hypothetical protein
MSYLSGTLTVEMAFGYAPLNTSPVWTDITSYVLDANINRGRSDEFSQYAQGTATLNLNNSTRIFDPYFETGTYFGLLRPMTPMRIKLDATIMFVGFVTAWPTKYDVSNKYAVSTIPCVDATRILQNMLLASSAFGKLVLADSSLMNFYPMQVIEPVGITCAKTNTVLALEIGGGSVTAGAEIVPTNFPTGATETLSPGQSFNSLNCQWSNQNATTSAPRSLEFWIDRRTQRNTSSIVHVIRDVSSAGISGRNIDELYVSVASNGNVSVTYSNVAANVGGSTTATINAFANIGANHVAVTVDNTNIRTYINGSLVNTRLLTAFSSTGFFNSSQTITAATGVSNVAIYNAVLSGATIAARYQAAIGFPNELSSTRLVRVLDDIGWPAAWRSIETGVQPVGTYRPANQPATQYMRQIENAEQGTICINREGHVRFENYNTVNTIKPVAFFSGLSGSTYPYNDIQIDANNVDAIFNQIDAKYEFGDVSVSDSTSITLYGPQVQNIDLSLMSTPDAAELAASVLLQLYKDPRLSVEQLSVNMLSNLATLEPFLPTLELGDDIVVIFQPNNSGTTIWRCLKVQGFSHTIRNDQWVTSIYLGPSPIQTNGPLLVLDNATFGTLNSTNVLG